MTPRACKICGRSLEGRHPQTRYCSDKCRTERAVRYAKAYYQNMREEVCYRVVSDPSGGYAPGVRLKAVKQTVAMNTPEDEYFATGMVLEKHGVNYEVRGKKMVILKGDV